MPFANPKLSMGVGTYQISLELFSLNRQRLVERLRPLTIGNALVVLQGGKEIPVYNTDITYDFRQEPYFRWAFGVSECDCYGAIEVDSGAAHLFVPRYPEKNICWMGPLHPPEDFQEKYELEYAYYTDEMVDVLKELNPSVLLVMAGINSDSGLRFSQTNFEGIEQFAIDDKTLYPQIADLRVIKTDYELEVMRYVTDVTSAAHRKVMRTVKPGMTEFQCEAEFLYHIYSTGGCKDVSYSCIACSGPNGAILHYGFGSAPKDRVLKSGDMCLFDMGANYFGYASDVTCSFPVDGKFTPDQKLIYEAVLKASCAVVKEAKSGASWPCLHLLANRILLAELKDGGLLQGDVSDMVKAGLGRIFQPHGLGHLIGLDVHDVGGYLPGNPRRLANPKGMENLRTTRVLQAGMVVTIEPGCYFADYLLDQAMEDSVLSQFLVPEAVKRFRGFGGVRIEDVVVVMETGVRNITTVPRSVEEIEKWTAKKDDDLTL